MKRIVQPFRIVFIDRNLGWSLAFFASSAGALGLSAMARERRWDPSSGAMALGAGAGSGVLFLLAFWLLFRKRAFIVDQANQLLTLIERRLLGAISFSCPLKDVTITMEQKRLINTSRGGTMELWVGRIWLTIEGRGQVPFLDDLRGSEARTLARQLAADLGRPLDVLERSDW
jgi:hypothetical protein